MRVKKAGIKRHIIVATQGLPHAILVTTANVTDRKGAIEMIMLNLDALSNVKKFLVNGGYSGKPFACAVAQLCGADVEVVKREELHKFIVIPLRWAVERTFGWPDKARRLWKNCERSLHNSLQMTILALVSVLIREKYLLRELPNYAIKTLISQAILATSKDDKICTYEKLTFAIIEEFGGFDIDAFKFKSDVEGIQK